MVNLKINLALIAEVYKYTYSKTLYTIAKLCIYGSVCGLCYRTVYVSIIKQIRLANRIKLNIILK